LSRVKNEKAVAERAAAAERVCLEARLTLMHEKNESCITGA
jgi:hypothetical protein